MEAPKPVPASREISATIANWISSEKLSFSLLETGGAANTCEGRHANYHFWTIFLKEFLAICVYKVMRFYFVVYR
jgi:hypothetical protein